MADRSLGNIRCSRNAGPADMVDRKHPARMCQRSSVVLAGTAGRTRPAHRHTRCRSNENPESNYPVRSSRSLHPNDTPADSLAHKNMTRHPSAVPCRNCPVHNCHSLSPSADQTGSPGHSHTHRRPNGSPTGTPPARSRRNFHPNGGRRGNHLGHMWCQRSEYPEDTVDCTHLECRCLPHSYIPSDKADCKCPAHNLCHRSASRPDSRQHIFRLRNVCSPRRADHSRLRSRSVCNGCPVDSRQHNFHPRSAHTSHS